MRLLLVSVTVLLVLSLCSGHSLSKFQAPEGHDFADTRRPFSNSHGYQYLKYDPEDIKHITTQHPAIISRMEKELEENPETSEEATTAEDTEEVTTEATLLDTTSTTDTEEVTTEAKLLDTTSTTDIPSNARQARNAQLSNMPDAPELKKLDYRSLPKFFTDLLTIHNDSQEDSEDVSNEYTGSEEYDSNSHSHETIDVEHTTDNYGMELVKDGGYIWNNLFLPNTRHIFDEELSIGKSSESEENFNSAAEDYSDQSGDASHEGSQSHEDSSASEWTSDESNSQSEEDHALTVEISNLEDIFHESNADLNPTNSEAENSSNADEREFINILRNMINMFTETEDKENVNEVLREILDDIVNIETNKPSIVFESEVDVSQTLNSVFTNIMNNYISITNDMVDGKMDLVANKDRVENDNVTTESVDAITNWTENPAANDTVSTVTNGYNMNGEITEEYTTMKYDGTTTDFTHVVNDEYLTEVINEDKVSVAETVKPSKDTECTENNGVISHTELIENFEEKFWTFMGDLAEKYMEKLIERTDLYIKQEVENHLKEHKQTQTEDETPTDKIANKINDNALYGDKTTNVYVFYLNKYSKQVVEDVKKIVNDNNGTNIFTFGMDNTNNVSDDIDNSSDVTDAPGPDITITQSTVLIDDTSNSILDLEPTNEAVETTPNSLDTATAYDFINDTKDINDIEYIVTTEGGLSDIITTEAVDITTENNGITVSPENYFNTSTTENETADTVTVIDSSDVTTQSDMVTSTDDTQVTMNIVVDVPITEAVIGNPENAMTTENIVPNTNYATIVADVVTATSQTIGVNPENIIDITTEYESTTLATPGSEDATYSEIVTAEKSESEVISTENVSDTASIEITTVIPEVSTLTTESSTDTDEINNETDVTESEFISTESDQVTENISDTASIEITTVIPEVSTLTTEASTDIVEINNETDATESEVISTESDTVIENVSDTASIEITTVIPEVSTLTTEASTDIVEINNETDATESEVISTESDTVIENVSDTASIEITTVIPEVSTLTTEASTDIVEINNETDATESEVISTESDTVIENVSDTESIEITTAIPEVSTLTTEARTDINNGTDVTESDVISTESDLVTENVSDTASIEITTVIPEVLTLTSESSTDIAEINNETDVTVISMEDDINSDIIINDATEETSVPDSLTMTPDDLEAGTKEPNGNEVTSDDSEADNKQINSNESNNSDVDKKSDEDDIENGITTIENL